MEMYMPTGEAQILEGKYFINYWKKLANKYDLTFDQTFKNTSPANISPTIAGTRYAALLVPRGGDRAETKRVASLSIRTRAFLKSLAQHLECIRATGREIKIDGVSIQDNSIFEALNEATFDFSKNDVYCGKSVSWYIGSSEQNKNLRALGLSLHLVKKIDGQYAGETVTQSGWLITSIEKKLARQKIALIVDERIKNPNFVGVVKDLMMLVNPNIDPDAEYVSASAYISFSDVAKRFILVPAEKVINIVDRLSTNTQ